MVQKQYDKRIFAGVLIIIAGLALLLSNFGIFPPEIKRYIFRWEVLLMGIGLVSVISSEHKGFGVVLLVVGGLFYFKDILDFQIDFWKLFWSALLIIIGLSILFHNKAHRRHGRAYANASVDLLDEVTIMGGSEKVIHSQNFQGGKLTSIFGGQKLIFTKAKLAGGQNSLELFAIFGGFELIIPDEWDVKVKITPIFGGFVDKRIVHPDSGHNPEKELLIYGTVIFGGGEIKSF
ncbi:MAG: hypothetical protein JXB00_02950 [Bacteroidales bacterium]|nr:hypothetical protein [Bacteroidales bacterium]